MERLQEDLRSGSTGALEGDTAPVAPLDDAVLGALPPVELPAGQVTFDEATAAALYRLAFQDAVAADRPDAPSAVVWFDGAAELLVHADRVQLACRDGLLLVGVPVFTDQAGDAELVVPFALAASDTAPLAAATETLPRGPAEIVERWGEAVTAAAWDALVLLATTVSAKAGRREIATLVAKPGRLRVLTAPHQPSDRSDR